VPLTVALHCAVARGLTVAGLQVALTAVMVDPGGGGAACCTVTEAFPVMEGSSVLVAVTVTV
jgi:hypothetical protein